jgi:hypothetical protein
VEVDLARRPKTSSLAKIQRHLRAIGFSGGSIIASVLSESMLLAAPGALLKSRAQEFELTSNIEVKRDKRLAAGERSQVRIDGGVTSSCAGHFAPAHERPLIHAS